MLTCMIRLKHRIETTANVSFLPLISPMPGKPYFILFLQKLESSPGQSRCYCISCICNLFLNWCHLWRCNKIIPSVIRSYYTLLCATNDKMVPDIDGLVRERRNSIANALLLRISCTYPSICRKRFPFHDSALGLWLNTQATSPCNYPSQLFCGTSCLLCQLFMQKWSAWKQCYMHGNVAKLASDIQAQQLAFVL